MITVAKRKKSQQSGQSVLEFLLLLPVLFGITVIMIRVNTAIQMAIVDQKYARAQALHYTQNSPYYPRRDHHYYFFKEKLSNQMYFSVTEQPADEDDPESLNNPKSSTYNVTRKMNEPQDSSVGEEPTERAFVRIRNTVSLCANSVFMQADGSYQETYKVMQEIGSSSAYKYCFDKNMNPGSN